VAPIVRPLETPSSVVPSLAFGGDTWTAGTGRDGGRSSRTCAGRPSWSGSSSGRPR